MIEQYFDEPIKKIGQYEFDLDEIDDLLDWFEAEGADIVDDLSDRERALYEWWINGG